MFNRFRLSTGLLFGGIAAVSACADGGSSQSTEIVSASDLATMPSWARTQNYVREVDSATPLRLQIHLAMRNKAAAEEELAAISDPHNPRYGQFLTSEQFAAKYAPTAEDVSVVKAYVARFGLSVDNVPDNREFLEVSGTAGQAASAFATRFGQYKVGTELRYAAVDPISLPAGVVSRVGAVLGLSEPLKAQNLSAPACSSYFGQVPATGDPALSGYPALTYLPCGYVPSQLRQAYGVDAWVRQGHSYDGTGQTIAIVNYDAPPTLLQDAQTYATNHDPTFPLASSQLTVVKVGNPATNPSAEAAGDVEAVHAIAPGANITYVAANSASDADLLSAFNTIVSGNLASVISSSWVITTESARDNQIIGIFYGVGTTGSPDVTGWSNLATQAGLKGIGLYFGSGDTGDYTVVSGIMSPTLSFPQSLPNMTTVGATSLALNSNNTRAFEVGWESVENVMQDVLGVKSWMSGLFPFLWGSGGGTSTLFAQPTWQQGIVPSSMANVHRVNGAPARVMPDVAMAGDPTTGGLLTGMTTGGVYGEQGFGGTSQATPMFTAMVALAQQNANRHFGFANPLLYQAAGGFTDIKPQSAQAIVQPYSFCVGGPLCASHADIAWVFDYHGSQNSIGTAPGYDNVTGLGSPNGTAFFQATKSPPSSLFIGTTSTSSLPNQENPNNTIMAQKVTVTATSTLQTLSFYETNGLLVGYLGLYDATGAGGGPGHLLATTGLYGSASAGWNTVEVTNPATVAPGTYWLAFEEYGTGDTGVYTTASGTLAYASFSPASLPATFPSFSLTQQTWGVYGTFVH